MPRGIPGNRGNHSTHRLSGKENRPGNIPAKTNKEEAEILLNSMKGQLKAEGANALEKETANDLLHAKLQRRNVISSADSIDSALGKTLLGKAEDPSIDLIHGGSINFSYEKGSLTDAEDDVLLAIQQGLEFIITDEEMPLVIVKNFGKLTGIQMQEVLIKL